MASQRTILVTSASGNIGSHLISMLAQGPNVKLVLPTSNAANLRSTCPHGGNTDAIAIEEGNIADPHWFQSLLSTHNVDTVFLCLRGGGQELDPTINILDCMRRVSSVKQCVYIGICGDYSSPEGIAHLSRTCDASHMLVKIPIELKLKHGRFPFSSTVLGPTLFFSNDQRAKKSLLERGVFDEPVDGASRVSPRDIALVAKNVMFAPKGRYDGVKIDVGSKHVYSGAEIAAAWSKSLGKEVSILGPTEENLRKFEEEWIPLAGAAFARDMTLMYRYSDELKGEGFGLSEEKYKLLLEVLGKEAEDYEEWVAEEGKRWLAEKA